MASSFVLPLAFSKEIPANYYFSKVAVILLLLIVFIYFIKRTGARAGLLFYVVFALLVSRISFDLFLMPYRQSRDLLTECRHDAIKLAKATKGHSLYYMTDTITMHNVYYITRERNRILTYKKEPESGSYFIVDDTLKAGPGFRKEYSMKVPYLYKTLYAGKFEKH
jgi:hypothetical protein